MLHLSHRRGFSCAQQRAQRARRASLRILPWRPSRSSIHGSTGAGKVRAVPCRRSKGTPAKHSRKSGRSGRPGRANLPLLPRVSPSDSGPGRCDLDGGQEELARHVCILPQQPAVSLSPQDSIRASRGTLQTKRPWTSGDGRRRSCSDLLGLSRQPRNPALARCAFQSKPLQHTRHLRAVPYRNFQGVSCKRSWTSYKEWSLRGPGVQRLPRRTPHPAPERP